MWNRANANIASIFFGIYAVAESYRVKLVGIFGSTKGEKNKKTSVFWRFLLALIIFHVKFSRQKKNGDKYFKNSIVNIGILNCTTKSPQCLCLIVSCFDCLILFLFLFLAFENEIWHTEPVVLSKPKRSIIYSFIRSIWFFCCCHKIGNKKRFVRNYLPCRCMHTE